MRSGWVREAGGVTDEKGLSRKRGGQDPLTHPPLYMGTCIGSVYTITIKSRQLHTLQINNF